MESILFTPAALLEILLNIEELYDSEISISENIDGTFNLQIGDSTYLLDPSEANSVQVDEDVLDTVESVNEDTYKSLESSGYVEFDDSDTIESGVLKSAIKSLLLGGMIRLSKKLLD